MSSIKQMESVEKPKREDFILDKQITPSVEEYIRSYWNRIRLGDIGSLPIILGVILIAIIFQSQNQNFLTPRNLVNLIVQMAGITAIAYGVVFVLLLGDIDLSVGYVGAVAGVGMTLLLRDFGWDWYIAIPVALTIVGGIGVLHGLIITTFQLPSFVVTLAGLLAWNGAVLILMGGSGTVIIQNRTVIGIANSFLPPLWGWIAVLIIVGIFALNRILRMITRMRQGLVTMPMSVLIAQVVILAALGAIIVYIANQDRGVPVVGIILLVLLVGLTFLAERTRFGRYVYAIGGNREAARRAGISVNRIRILVFMLSSIMAGFGGIILASRLRSVDTAAGGGNLLLNAIAAAVIGGTSLFGGSGRVISAVFGALIIASVENGMGLLGMSSGNKFIITGLVLLAAVIVDAVSRRRQKQSGIA